MKTTRRLPREGAAGAQTATPRRNTTRRGSNKRDLAPESGSGRARLRWIRPRGAAVPPERHAETRPVHPRACTHRGLASRETARPAAAAAPPRPRTTPPRCRRRPASHGASPHEAAAGATARPRLVPRRHGQQPPSTLARQPASYPARSLHTRPPRAACSCSMTLRPPGPCLSSTTTWLPSPPLVCRRPPALRAPRAPPARCDEPWPRQASRPACCSSSSSSTARPWRSRRACPCTETAASDPCRPAALQRATPGWTVRRSREATAAPRPRECSQESPARS
jgi:hypothetical protein